MDIEFSRIFWMIWAVRLIDTLDYFTHYLIACVVSIQFEFFGSYT